MKKIISILVAMFIGAGFLGSASADQERGPNIGDCEKPGVTPIIIMYKKGELRVQPATAETERGMVLKFILVGNGDASVNVRGKNKDDDWIEGSAAKGVEMFYVCVRPDLKIPDPEKGKVFEYYVDVPGVGYLDPEVIVKGGG